MPSRPTLRAPREVDGIVWAQEVAFVEHHGPGRIVVRGTFAGHYVDADDFEDFVGRRVTEGALAGRTVGLLLGPPGLAAGFVAGGSSRVSRASTPVRSFAASCSTRSARRSPRNPQR